MSDARELQALLGPTARVAREQALPDTYYVLSNVTGELYAYSAGHRKTVPESLVEQVKKTHFAEQELAVAKPAKKPTTVRELDYETQERYHACSDILAGVKPSTKEDRRRATRYVGIVHDRLTKNFQESESNQ